MASVYREAARVLEVVEKGSSVKQAALGTSGVSNRRKCMALVSGVVSQKQALEAALRESGTWAALEAEKVVQRRSQRCLALVAAYDVSAGKGVPKRTGGKLMRVLKARVEVLKKAFEKNGGASADNPNRDTAKRESRRRFARCNPLAGATADAMLEALIEANGGETQGIHLDPDVPGLIEFPASLAAVVNASHELVTSGRVVLQDKASCFPALALSEIRSPGACLDCCAAPGNKTTQLAALTRSRVVALDRDRARLRVLERRVAEARCAHLVDAHLADCLEFDPPADVRNVLLDPSCSGSGLADLDATSAAENRLEKLAAFQLQALVRVLTAFPNVDAVVYSTCSVHIIENEDVVAAALRRAPDFDLVPCLEFWPRRGLPTAGLSADLASRLLRVDPDQDRMTGFFVALFRRRSASDEQSAPAGRTSARNLKRKLKRKKRRRLNQEDATPADDDPQVPPPRPAARGGGSCGGGGDDENDDGGGGPTTTTTTTTSVPHRTADTNKKKKRRRIVTQQDDRRGYEQ